MNHQLFKRKIYSQILQWKQQSAGSTALMIQGARRVGKSTIAQEFAKKEYESFISIDFSEAEQVIIDLFEDKVPLDYLFLTLQNFYGTKLHERKSVIIFDEIQLCPSARQAIKRLVRDGRFDYIETGSLLTIKKNVQNILIPSEETRINMFPLDFEEFLWAIEQPLLFESARYAFEKRRPMGDSMHRTMMRYFRLYMLVGGMPQAIEAFNKTGDMASVDAIKRNILELYKDDFRKIDPLGRLSNIFRSIPAELARNTLRYKVGSVIENATANRIAEPLMEMSESLTVNFSFHSNDPSVGFALHANPDFFKLFLADTGLFVTLAFQDATYVDNEIYRKLLVDKLPVDLGYVYENVVAQMLRTAGNELYYYTFKETDDSKKNYEIDFLISRKGKICPIEVKSSGYNRHISLDLFRQKFSSRILQSYIINTKDLQTDGDIISIPAYMTLLL